MDEFKIILNGDEKKNIHDNDHDLHVKLFLEQIIPYINKNPGCLQAILKRSFPEEDYEGFFYTKISEFFYYLSRENLIKRIKVGNTYKLYLNSDFEQIKSFLNLSWYEWKNKIAYKPPPDIHIQCNVYQNKNQMISRYFGKDIIKIFKSYMHIYDSSSIGASYKFEINDVLETILKKYWTDECEKELKNYLLKYGFFADQTFSQTKYKQIIGEKKYNELIYELIHHASEIEISHCGMEILSPYYIPSSYIKSFKFKWGLKPKIIEKKCKICKQYFIPIWHLSHFTGFIENLNDIDFCHICLQVNEREECKVTLSKNEMIQYIHEFIEIFGFVPASDFRANLPYEDLDKKSLNRALLLFKKMPPYEKSYYTPHGYKDVFGSWLKTLIEAGVLENDSQKMSFGYKVLANDGHECLSLGEKNIDDWLYLNKIPHDKEPLYPGVFLRADWKVGNYFIEYWGLYGNEDYDDKILIKREIAEEYKIPLIEIFPEDIPNLELKLGILK